MARCCCHLVAPVAGPRGVGAECGCSDCAVFVEAPRWVVGWHGGRLAGGEVSEGEGLSEGQDSSVFG
eukprot:1144657-Pelagomonas_calceolata.AAC.3